MAHWLVVPPAEWIGDRSYIPHRAKRAPRSRHRKAAAAEAGDRVAGAQNRQ
jgi:hypothetical protein